MALTADSIVQVAAEVVSCDLDGETAILNTHTGDYFGLDEVGASVWRLIRQPQTVAGIIEEISAEYDVDPTRCQTDLLALVGQLAAHGLVVVSDRV